MLSPFESTAFAKSGHKFTIPVGDLSSIGCPSHPATTPVAREEAHSLAMYSTLPGIRMHFLEILQVTVNNAL